MRIRELACQTGVSIRSLRYYEQKQLIASHRLGNGYRDFDKIAIERVRAIQLYLGLGLNTEQIGQIINCDGKHTVPQKNPLCEELLVLYEEKLQEIEKQITSLDVVRSRLQERIAYFNHMKTTEHSHDSELYLSLEEGKELGEVADEPIMLQGANNRREQARIFGET